MYGQLPRLIPIMDPMLREIAADKYPSYQTERMASSQSVRRGRDRDDPFVVKGMSVPNTGPCGHNWLHYCAIVVDFWVSPDHHGVSM